MTALNIYLKNLCKMTFSQMPLEGLEDNNLKKKDPSNFSNNQLSSAPLCFFKIFERIMYNCL